MSEVPTVTSGETTNRLQIILNQAEERYGPEAVFVYIRRQQKEFVAMSLADAMAICGEFIADEDDALLWATLDKWHAMAGVMAEKSPTMLDRAQELGRNVLNECSIRVGEAGGNTE